MHVHKKYIFIPALAVGVVVCAAAVSPSPNGYKNLKILPQNISTKELSSIMVDEFTAGLGVSCAFCHAKEGNSLKLDYASDANPEKAIARQMMKITLGINKKYFKVRHPIIGDSLLVITCHSCHRGQPFPEEP